MKELLTAIYSRFTGSALEIDLTGGMHLHQAPLGTAMPYGVFLLVSVTPEYTFDTVHEHVLVQMSLYSDRESAVQITDLAAAQPSLYDDCRLDVTGYRFGGMERELSQMFRDDDHWHHMTQYRVVLEKI